jgi:hypothetical protein
MSSVVESWNRRLHIYCGLFSLFFLWLFCLSGVVLNHPKWRIAEFWAERKQTAMEMSISIPAGGDDTTAARSLMGQLGLKGEVSGKVTHSASGGLDFQIVRPATSTK